jgi:uncharacterized protein (DUF952 family)
MESVLFHIIGEAEWADAERRERYAPDSLRVEGFIHLSERGQILRPANLLYEHRHDLRLLVIDRSRLSADLVYEAGSHGEDELFPHLYGQLNIDAVSRSVRFPCGADGRFQLPADI